MEIVVGKVCCEAIGWGGEGRGGRTNSYIGSSLDDSNLVFEIPVYGLFIFAPVVGRVAS